MTMRQFQSFLEKCRDKQQITRITPAICPATSRILEITIEINSAVFRLKATPSASLEQQASACLERLERARLRLDAVEV